MLLVEDHVRLAGFIRKGLEAAEFDVDAVETAATAAEALACTRYDAVVLDLGLPDMDGLDLLKSLRRKQTSVPVLVLTSRIQVADRVAGLNAGADDYLTKPFVMEELVARLHALLRRPHQTLGPVLEAGEVTLDVTAREARVAGRPVALSRRELGLLEQLLRRSGKVVPKTLIEQSLYGVGDELSSNSVEVLVHRLRKKLSDAAAKATIHTVRGVGYMIVPAARH
ncbi:MAG: response regulator [Kiloniellaceae bacterium]